MSEIVCNGRTMSLSNGIALDADVDGDEVVWLRPQIALAVFAADAAASDAALDAGRGAAVLGLAGAPRAKEPAG